MEQQPSTSEFGPEEQRREVFGRLLYFSFGRFVKFVVNLCIELLKLVKQFVKDAVRMLINR